MAFFDYKVVPAPRRMKRARGVTAHEELFALTLTDAINEHARQGWEYVRAETLTAEGPGGWFRRGAVEEQSVLVFRRERETLGPRVTPAAGPAPAAIRQAAPEPEPAFADGDFAPRPEPAPPLRRREPLVGDPDPIIASAPRVALRPVPHLGPAERG